jgi:hypothetical protein
METIINFVQRYEILLLVFLIIIVYFVCLTFCLRHLARNKNLTREEKKKWVWHMIHWNIFAIPVYWKKYMVHKP